MGVLLFRDGTHVEVAQGADVIHKLGYLVCIDHASEPLITVPADDVVAYTRNFRVAEELLDRAEAAGSQATTASTRPAKRRFGRRRKIRP